MQDKAIGKVILSVELPDCEVGVPKDITLRVTATRNDSSGFEAPVHAVRDYEEEEEDDDASETGKPSPTPTPKHPPDKEMAPAMDNY